MMRLACWAFTSFIFTRIGFLSAFKMAFFVISRKLILFFVTDNDDISDEFHCALNIWKKFAPNSNPAMTAVRAYELSHPGVSIQADCIAIKR